MAKQTQYKGYENSLFDELLPTLSEKEIITTHVQTFDYLNVDGQPSLQSTIQLPK